MTRVAITPVVLLSKTHDPTDKPELGIILHKMTSVPQNCEGDQGQGKSEKLS